MDGISSKKIISTVFLLLAVAIIFGLIWLDQKKEENAGFVLAPIKGDIYEIKKDENHFTIYKVVRIDIDSVFVWKHQKEVSSASDLKELKESEDESFDKLLVGFSKAELVKMFEVGKIEGVVRK